MNWQTNYRLMVLAWLLTAIGWGQSAYFCHRWKSLCERWEMVADRQTALIAESAER